LLERTNLSRLLSVIIIVINGTCIADSTYNSDNFNTNDNACAAAIVITYTVPLFPENLETWKSQGILKWSGNVRENAKSQEEVSKKSLNFFVWKICVVRENLF